MFKPAGKDGFTLRRPLARVLAASVTLSLAMTPAYNCTFAQQEEGPQSIGDIFSNLGDDLSDAWHDLEDLDDD